MAKNAPIIYRKLKEHFGFLNWWPSDSEFEVFVGAILTQQTTWTNVEKAINNLKNANSLSIDKIAEIKISKLEKLIRPSGYYRKKAKRLRNLCGIIIRDHKNLDNLFRLEKNELRALLLSYNGVGRETADSIVLYAASKPTFVIDAYTKRIMHRMFPKIIDEQIDYDALRISFERSINKDLDLYKDYHAQFVELGKNYCKKTKPLCNKCPLQRICVVGTKKLTIRHTESIKKPFI
jgi:endonuclease III related protein